MNKTVLFLIVLIAPMTFAQKDFLSMIEKTAEGKEVLDNLFIQSKLMGPKLDVNSIRHLLNSVLENTTTLAKTAKERYDSHNTQYQKDRKEINDLLHDQMEKEYTVKKSLEASVAHHKRKQNFLNRSIEERENYIRFTEFIQSNKKDWQYYYNGIEEAVKSSLEFFQRIETALKGGHSTAFVELPSNFQTNLAEIKTAHSQINFGDLTPVVANMLEIMQDSSAVGKVGVRASIVALVEQLTEAVRIQGEKLAEENEHQMALYAGLEKAFSNNAEFVEKHIEYLKESLAGFEERRTSITQQVTQEEGLTAQIQEIMSLRTQEHRAFNSGQHYNTVRLEKINTIVAQIQGFFPSNVNKVKTYFLEREMKGNN